MEPFIVPFESVHFNEKSRKILEAAKNNMKKSLNLRISIKLESKLNFDSENIDLQNLKLNLDNIIYNYTSIRIEHP